MGKQRATDYDVLIVGSGFGGSVSALRLVEKGYKVGVIEAADGMPTKISRRPVGISRSSSGLRSWGASAFSACTCCATASFSRAQASAAGR